MNEPIIDGNCGELCNYHCCRSHKQNGEKLGMYLLPLEYDMMQSEHKVTYEIHSSYNYALPKGVKKLHYIFCSDDSGCFRNHRPIQCRTYPFEPHMRDGELSLVIEKDQLHACPLIKEMDTWRKEFILGVYEAWSLLISLEPVKRYIIKVSAEREGCNNIEIELDQFQIEKYKL